MSKIKQMSAWPRPASGKQAARAVRRNGMVPAIIYGGDKENSPISLNFNELIKILDQGGFRHTVFELSIEGGETETVLPRILDLHPVKDLPIHIDFIRLRPGQTVQVDLPIELVDTETSPGIKLGGIPLFERHELRVNVPYNAIPNSIVISVGGMNIQDSVHASDIKLPEGCSLASDADVVVMAIAAPKISQAAAASTEEGKSAEPS